jgi:hypothetical protein
VDSDISEDLDYASNIRSNNGKPDNFLARDEWKKLTSSQKEILVSKRWTEVKSGVFGSKQHLSQHRRQANIHKVDLFVS